MKKIKKLEELIKYHKALYYQGRPEISDQEFDKIEKDLKGLDPESPMLNIVGSVTNKTGKAKHKTKMLSLNKVYEEEELISWQDDNEVVSTHKIDGVSCSIIYDQGRLSLAKTRGDGQYGEDITDKVRWVSSVAVSVSDLSKFEVRGELFCSEKNFILLSDEMESLNHERPSSQRNIVAGLMGRKEGLAFSRYLTFYAFDFLSENSTIKTEIDKFKYLEKLGFETPEYVLHKNHKKIEKIINDTKDFMMNGHYQIDGLVFTYNDLALQDRKGSTSHHPRYKMAFKYAGVAKDAVIDNISWQVSRNGILTPIANIQAIELGGAMISRVTLHNYGLVKAHQLKSNDVISVIRSGEVIPKFLEVRKGSTSTFSVPELCPSCESKVIIDDIRLLCPNETCPARIREEILNFIKKIGIDDLSEKRLEELMNANLVKDTADLFKLSEDDFKKLDKVKDKLATKLVSSIEKVKNPDLITFLSSLGLRGGAYNKCEKIVRNGYDTLEKVLSLNVENLVLIEGFAEKSADDLIKSLNDKRDLINSLLDAGFSISEDIKNESGELYLKKVCITGTLSRKRTELEDMVRAAGGIMVSSVSKNTDFLVTNDKSGASSKFKKATSLNIPIISEDNFIKLL
jgi:DNA ligase (NAD+)